MNTSSYTISGLSTPRNKIVHLLIFSVISLAGCNGSGAGETTATAPPPPPVVVPLISIVAGDTSASGGADGVAQIARFNKPSALAIDSTGSIYIADTGNFTIRKLTANGAVSTIAGTNGIYGTQDGTGNTANFSSPTALAVDQQGSLYVADSVDSSIVASAGLNPSTLSATVRRVSNAGEVKTISKYPLVFLLRGLYGGARLIVATDKAGTLFSGSDDGVIPMRKTFASSVEIVLPCGQGCSPSALATDTLGNLYFESRGAIRRMAPDGTVVLLTGDPFGDNYGNRDGIGAEARFNYTPRGMAVDSLGNVFLADTNSHTIRKITPAGVVTTIAGQAGTSGFTTGAPPGLLTLPKGIVVDAANSLYVVTGNAVVKIAP
jgi:hypothetical protein